MAAALAAFHDRMTQSVLFGPEAATALFEHAEPRPLERLPRSAEALAAAGIVSLPGMMTGQILAGSPPLQAVAYQIVVMFMIAAAVAGGAMRVVLLAGRHFMGADAVLRLDRLQSH